MRFTRRAAIALCFAPAFATALRAQGAQPARITFVLTNDIYLMDDTAMPDGQRRGGFARLAAAVKAERAKGGTVIFAHAGDTLSPSLMSSVDQGAHIITLSNMIRPDIFVPGNHEFDFGKRTFLTRMAEAKFDRYAANLRAPDGAPLAGFKDRTIIAVGDARIGITGATFDASAQTSTPEDLKFSPTVEVMKQQAEMLRQEGADFVVAVVHATRRQGLELAASRAADLVLSGHTHDLFVDFDGRNALVESSFDAHYVTMIDVAIEVTPRSERRDVRWWPTFRIVDTATVAPDPEVAAVVAGFEKQLDREMATPLCTTDVELESDGALLRTRETAIGSLVADAMRAATRADAAIMNGGGIRGGKLYPVGSAITRRDVLSELPFGNRVVVVDLVGRDLQRALENGLSLLPRSSGRFPQVSGLTVEFDPHRPAGSRILSIGVGGAPLDPDRRYRTAINDFLARGGDGYTTLRDAAPELPMADAPALANAVMDYLRRIGTVRPFTGPRLIEK